MEFQGGLGVGPEAAWCDLELAGQVIAAGWGDVDALGTEGGGRAGHMDGDHVHMCISIPPKYAVSEVIGYLKGKSAIAVARQFAGRQRNFSGENLWARGYAVSTVGFELAKVKEYIEHQEKIESDQEDGRF